MRAPDPGRTSPANSDVVFARDQERKLREMNLHPAAAWPSSFNSLNVNANHGAQAQGPEGKELAKAQRQDVNKEAI